MINGRDIFTSFTRMVLGTWKCVFLFTMENNFLEQLWNVSDKVVGAAEITPSSFQYLAEFQCPGTISQGKLLEFISQHLIWEVVIMYLLGRMSRE